MASVWRQDESTGYAPPAALLPASQRIWVPFVFILLYTLTFPNIKIPTGLDLRLGQVVLMMGVFVLFLRDAYLREMRWNALLALVGAGLLLSCISYLAPFPKIKQVVFIIKYTMVYPSAFYMGARVLCLIPLRRFLQVLEITLALACIGGIALEFFPIVPLVHPRPAYLVGIKGSFWEQGSMAFVLGLFLITSLALRLQTGLWPARRRYLLWGLYVLVLGCAVATRNKTIWIALGFTLLFGVALYRDPRRARGAGKAWWLLCAVLVVCAFGVGLGWYNHSLPPGDKIVSEQMLAYKWENERGAALRIVWALIQQNPIFGKGFGFVEAYFGTHSAHVIGLGVDTGAIFNSYLDIWLSVGVFGLIYSFGLLKAAFNRDSLLAVFVVIYVFVCVNFNPYAQTEYYYLFLGLCWATHERLPGAGFNA